MFNINYTKLVQWLVPVWLRQPNILLLVLTCNWALRETYANFLTFRTATLYRLAHNGQVCSLQAMLNDLFDVTARRIRIVDFASYGSIFFWVDTDNPHVVFMGDDNVVYFYPDDVGLDFTVELPSDIVTTTYELALLKAQVNLYKLPGKQYNIVRF